MTLFRATITTALAAMLATTIWQPGGASGAPDVPPDEVTTRTAASADFRVSTTSAAGWTGSAALRLTATTSNGQPTLAATAATRTPLKVRTRSVTRDAQGKAGTRYRLTARVRTQTTRAVNLLVHERHAGKAINTKLKTTKVRPGVWQKVKVTTTARRATPRFRVAVASTHLTKGERILVRTVNLRRLATRATSPAPGNDKTNNNATGAGTLTNGCAYTRRGLPKCGSYLGMAYGSNTDPTTLEKSLGGRLGVRRTYFRADQVAGAVRIAKEDLQRGRLPWVSFKLPHSWADMASGRGDAWAKDIATKFAALPGPVWVAFHHEPENDGKITDWRKMQERLAPLVRNTAPNVAFTVVLTGWHQFYGPAEYSLDAIWPRNVKVDVAGFDIYNSHGVVKDGKTLKPTNMDSAYFAKIEAWAKPKNLAWGLAETGYTDKAAIEDPNWIRRTNQELEARGGVAMAYFNTALNSIAPWTLGTDAKKDAYLTAQKGTPRLPLP